MLNAPMTAPGSTPLARSARVGLAVLTLINLFNYLDRWIVAALAESMKHSELHLSDTQLGLLMTGFLVVYMLAAPLFGSLGDRRSRTRLLGLGVGIWSLATALGGLARNYAGLFAARAAVGIGEAAYGTISPALLADYVPRQAFFVAGIPGLVLALLALRLYDPPRGSQDAGAPHAAGSTRDTYRTLLRNRPYLLTVLGYAAYTFAIGALAFWTPAFLERARGIPKAHATVQF